MMKEKKGSRYFRFAQKLYHAGIIGRAGLENLYIIAYRHGKITRWDIDCNMDLSRQIKHNA